LTNKGIFGILFPEAKEKAKTPERVLIMAMNMNEIRTTARQMTIAALMDALTANDAVKFDDASFAILQTVGEQEVWTEVTIKSKSWKDTKTSKAFDPYEAAEAWEAEKKIKEADKAAKAAEKAKKVAKAKEKEGE